MHHSSTLTKLNLLQFYIDYLSIYTGILYNLSLRPHLHILIVQRLQQILMQLPYTTSDAYMSNKFTPSFHMSDDAVKNMNFNSTYLTTNTDSSITFLLLFLFSPPTFLLSECYEHKTL